MEVLGNWLIIAFVAPILWAIVNVIDVYFVESVYEDEYDGAMISGLFQILPWILVPFGLISFRFPGMFAASLAVLGGSAFLLAFFFYFRALFRMNDVSLTQLMWNLSIILVPLFAWFIAQERLAPLQYLAIVIAFAGASALALDKDLRQRGLKDLMGPMVPSVIFLSLSMALQERAYSESGGDFWGVFLLFSLGSMLVALVLTFIDVKRSVARVRHISALSKRYFLVFVVAESISLAGTLTSQRAIDLAPAVSFMAVVESLLPAIVIFISFALSFVFMYFDRDMARKLYADQTVGLKTKAISIAMIALAIYLVS